MIKRYSRIYALVAAFDKRKEHLRKRKCKVGKSLRHSYCWKILWPR